MHEIDTAARREDPAQPISGLDAKRVADEGLRDNSARKAAQRIVKEIRARRNPISFDGTEFESSLGDV
jgi:hypothetical protein